MNADELVDDERVQEMAKCLLFVINNLKDELVMSTSLNGEAEGMHDWFERALKQAGFKVIYHAPPDKKKRGKKR